jgi:hypothetical protein
MIQVFDHFKKIFKGIRKVAKHNYVIDIDQTIKLIFKISIERQDYGSQIINSVIFHKVWCNNDLLTIDNCIQKI